MSFPLEDGGFQGGKGGQAKRVCLPERIRQKHDQVSECKDSSRRPGESRFQS